MLISLFKKQKENKKMSNKGIKNLKPIYSGQLSQEELKKRQSNGGKKSAKIRAEKRKMKEILEILLANPTLCEGKEISNKEAMLVKVVQKAVNEGDLKSIEFIRDTISEKSTEKVEATNMNLDITDEAVIEKVFEKIKQL